MKKFLSLMLAMIMVMSLVTVGAGAADFTDAADIEYTEAVELMASLKILQGSDGAFDPKGNLSRAAGSKIVAYIALGATKAEKLTYGGETTFPDVESTSSTAPYIAWCAEQGIINGYTDGTFGRKNPLTGYAYLKMVLNAVGEYGKYTGSGWQDLVESKAKNAGLLAGIPAEVVAEFGNPVSREVASQIAFNAMNFSRTEKEGYLVDGIFFTDAQGTGLVNAANYIALMKLDATPRYVNVAAGTLLSTVHGTKTVTGMIVANQATGETYTKIATLTETKDSDDKVTAVTIGDTADYNVTTELGDIGKIVTVYYDKTGKDGKVASLAEKSTAKVVAKAIDKADDLKAVFGDPTKIQTGTAVKNFVDYTGSTAATIGGLIKDADKYVGAAAGTYVLYKGFIVGYIAPASKTLSQVEDIDDTKDAQYIKLAGYDKMANGVKTKDGDKEVVTDIVIEYADIAEDDYVVVTKAGKLTNLAKATTVTGKPTKVEGEVATATITIDGVAYAQYGANKTTDKKSVAELLLTKEVTLYLDGQGNYIVATAVAGEEAPADIVYVANVYKVAVAEKKGTVNEYGETTGAAYAHNTYFAQVVTLDGTKALYPITKAEYIEFTGNAALASKNDIDTLSKVVLEKGKDTDEAISGTGDKTKYVEATFADFQTIGTKDELKIASGVVLGADVKAGAIKLTDGYYFDTAVTNLWISGDGSKLKVSTKDGVQEMKKDDVVDVVYMVEDDMKVVQYVIIEKELKTETVYTGEVIYVVKDATSTKQVATYTDEDGKTQIAYEHEVYVDGVKTTVKLTTDEIKAGFKQWTAVADGIYEIEKLDSKVADSKAVEGLFRGMISIKDVTAKDIDVTGVKVVDLTGAETELTDATKITEGSIVSVVLEKAVGEKTNKIVTIYLIELAK